MPANALPPERRLRRRGEFQRVFDAGRRSHGRYLTIVSLTGSEGESRLGIVASRKLGGAVVRNRAKRLIREAFRTSGRPRVPVDLVIIPKAALVNAKGNDVSVDFVSTLKRMGLSKP